MDIFLTVAGLIIGVSVFLYTVSFFDGGRKKLAQGATGQRSGSVPTRGTPASASSLNRPSGKGFASTLSKSDVLEGMPQRTCPLCSTTLSRNEPLYATHMVIGQQKKVFIHGCQYCYKEEKSRKII
jgi:hypothetical protein